MENLPKHIAIIPDGNRRWARNKNLLPWKGHFEGAKRAEEMLEIASEIGIDYLTFWASSYDNLVKRSKIEVRALDKVYREMAEKALKDSNVLENVRVRVIGEYKKLLSPKTIKSLEKLEDETKGNKKMNLTLLLGYNGDREMLSAINNLIKKKIKVSDKNLKDNLWTKDLPPVDLIIRTGGEPHLSAGFMMWDVRYSLLYFSDNLWPEFTKKEFRKAIKTFSSRERRKGK